MPAPPMSFTCTRAVLAAEAIRSASAIGSSSGPLPPIDFDHDCLEVCHLLEGEASTDASDPAVLARATAERQVRLPVVGGFIDVDPTHLQVVGEPKGTGQVARVNGAQQAVGR